jgi:hypothetical protein
MSLAIHHVYRSWSLGEARCSMPTIHDNPLRLFQKKLSILSQTSTIIFPSKANNNLLASTRTLYAVSYSVKVASFYRSAADQSDDRVALAADNHLIDIPYP